MMEHQKYYSHMFIINGTKFYDSPCMCGSCHFFISNGKMEGGRQSQMGFCTLFDKKKNYYGNLPQRCTAMFDKASTYPDGTELCLVAKTN